MGRDPHTNPPSAAWGSGCLAATPSPILMLAPRGPAAPRSPAHFKRPHLSPSAPFERGEFPAPPPAPVTVIENLRCNGLSQARGPCAQRGLINLPQAEEMGRWPRGPQPRTPLGLLGPCPEQGPQAPPPAAPGCREHVLLINF